MLISAIDQAKVLTGKAYLNDSPETGKIYIHHFICWDCNIQLRHLTLPTKLILSFHKTNKIIPRFPPKLTTTGFSYYIGSNPAASCAITPIRLILNRIIFPINISYSIVVTPSTYFLLLAQQPSLFQGNAEKRFHNTSPFAPYLTIQYFLITFSSLYPPIIILSSQSIGIAPTKPIKLDV